MLDALVAISSLSILIPVFAGLHVFKRFDDPFIKPFYLMILVSLLNEMFSWYLFLREESTLWLFNFYVVIYLLFILFAYKQYIGNLWTYAIAFINVPLLTFLIFRNSLSAINVLDFNITFLQLIVFSIFVLFKLSDTSEDVFREPIFWGAFGTLFYCSCTLMTFSLAKYVTDNSNQALSTYYQIYHFFINIVTNCFYAKALLCHKLKKTY